MTLKNNKFQERTEAKCTMDDNYTLYVGTYSRPILFGTGEVVNGRGLGIYCLAFDTERNSIDVVGVPQDAENPSYITLNSDNSLLFAVNELKQCDSVIGGRISSYKINPQTGSFELISGKNTFGEDPCHIQIDGRNRFLYVSNYSGGSASIFCFDSDGIITDEIYHLQHHGKGVNVERQEKPHIHSSALTPDGHAIVFVDLGLDMIELCPVTDNGINISEAYQYILDSGSGPRACVFNKKGNICYIVNELSNTVSVLSYDYQRKSFRLLQSISTLHGEGTANTAATICLSKDENQLFVSNRGLDDISTFLIDPKTGLLEYSCSIPSGGNTPRHFSISKDGKYLVCCNQDSDNISIFRIENGRLQRVCSKQIPSPSCAVFVN